MPKFNNFATNINTLRQNYKKFIVSRVIDNPANSLLEIQVPPTIPNNFTVEMQFYSLETNELIQTMILDSEIDTDVFKVVTFTYNEDNASTRTRRLLFIDFSTVEIDIGIGRLEVVLNFFVPQIGSSTESTLLLNKISNSRKEVELVLSTEYDSPVYKDKILMFAERQITPELATNGDIVNDWVLTTAAYMCNYTPEFNTNIPTDQTPLNFDLLKNYLPVADKNILNSDTTSDAFKNAATASVQTLLNRTYGLMTESIKTYRVNNGNTTIFTQETLFNMFSSSLNTAFSQHSQRSEVTIV